MTKYGILFQPWEIWKERNRRIFKNLEMSISQLINKIEISITEVINNYLKKTPKLEGTFMSWDAEIKKIGPKSLTHL